MAICEFDGLQRWFRSGPEHGSIDAYRADIDGLRALAVISVILFHAECAGFGGGFVGVDVFLVISGFLITRIILADVREGRFSFLDFYERRVRRILPAFLLVSAVACVGSWFILLPLAMEDFSRSLVAAAGFVSNIWIWSQSSYFDHDAHLKPLLHTWSLAVEEQFYLLFPLVLLLLLRLGSAASRWFVAAGAAISFVSAEFASRYSPSAAFYFLPTRGWELLTGSCMALLPAASLDWRLAGRLARLLSELACLAGLVLIGLSVGLLSSSTPFPGRFALAPVVGTCLIIVCGRGSRVVAWILRTRLLVGLGLISYSLYLWHQVLFALVRHANLVEPAAWQLPAAVVVSILLAWISWRLVELPFRDKRRFRRSGVLAGAALGLVLLAGFGWIGALSRGWPGRVPQEAMQFEGVSRDRNPRSAECHAKEHLYISPETACVLGDPLRVVGALIGDSHADALAHQLGLMLKDAGMGLKHLSYSGCPPVLGMYRADAGTEHRCADYNLDVSRYLASEESLRHVVMIARWPLYFEGTRFDNTEGGIEWGGAMDLRPASVGRDQALPRESRKVAFAAAIRDSVSRLLAAGKIVTLVYAVPEVGANVPVYLAKSRWRSGVRFSVLTTSHDVYLARNRGIDEILDAIPDSGSLRRIRPEKIFCNPIAAGRCRTMENGKILYFDDNHLSSHGARLLAKAVVDSFGGALEFAGVH